MFTPTWTIEKQSWSSELLHILDFSDIVLPTCWNLLFYFQTNVIFSVDDDNDDDDDDNEAWDFSSTATLLIVKSGGKSFCNTECNLLVWFWPFDEEIKLWEKEQVQKMGVPLVFVWTFKHEDQLHEFCLLVRSILQHQLQHLKLWICPSWQSDLKDLDLYWEIHWEISVRYLISNNCNKFDEKISEVLQQSFSTLWNSFLS